MLYKKTVHLKNWVIDRDVKTFMPPKDIEVAWKEADRKNEECYATLISHSKKLLDKTASEMPLLSERARTLRDLPKFRIINSNMERII